MTQHPARPGSARAKSAPPEGGAALVALRGFAAAADTGKATLSAIENARANPTVETLATLAAALDVDLIALLESPPADEVTLVRAGEGEVTADGLGRLGGVAAGELHRASFEPRSTVVARPRPAGTRAHVVVTHGTLVAGPAEPDSRARRRRLPQLPG